MRLALLTPFSADPQHPRVPSIASALRELGVEVRIEHVSGPPDSPGRFLDLASLGNFDLRGTVRALRRIRGVDLVWIEDLRLLLLAPLAKASGCRVVYETLDNNVHLNFYRLARRCTFLGRLRFLRGTFEALEICLSRLFCDSVVVNSDALAVWFRGRARVIPYSSPLEEHGIVNDSSLPPALFYLGRCSPEKGSQEMLDLAASRKLPLIVVGDRAPPGAGEGVVAHPRLGPRELGSLVSELTRRHSLVGLSLIRPVHRSYATQEANKDIDYLAIGAPIVGNHRGPTEDKIRKGAGVFVDDELALNRLLSDSRCRARAGARARDLYEAEYCRRLFREKLGAAVRDAARGTARSPGG